MLKLLIGRAVVLGRRNPYLSIKVPVIGRASRLLRSVVTRKVTLTGRLLNGLPLASIGPFRAKALAPLSVIIPSSWLSLRHVLFPTKTLRPVVVVSLSMMATGAEIIKVYG